MRSARELDEDVRHAREGLAPFCLRACRLVGEPIGTFRAIQAHQPDRLSVPPAVEATLREIFASTGTVSLAARGGRLAETPLSRSLGGAGLGYDFHSALKLLLALGWLRRCLEDRLVAPCGDDVAWVDFGREHHPVIRITALGGELAAAPSAVSALADRMVQAGVLVRARRKGDDPLSVMIGVPPRSFTDTVRMVRAPRKRDREVLAGAPTMA